MTTFRAFLCLAVASAACERPDAVTGSSTSAIVNGSVDPADPAVVFVSIGNFASCTGTVVSPHVVLTAAHCLYDQMSVSIGPTDSQLETTIPVRESDSDPEADIAMLALELPAPVTPIPMFDGDLATLIGQPVRIVGYGVTTDSGSDSGIKRQGMTVLHSIEEEIMYTGYEGSNTCYGDSGGPNFMTIAGVENVVGVTSFGTTSCGMPADGAVRTDFTMAWLSAFIDAHEDAQAPTVTILSPGDQASVEPGFAVTAQASDDRGVLRVELLVDDQVNDADETPPYELNALPTVALGPHQVEVRALDLAHNMARAGLAVTVAAACAADAECEAGDTCQGGICLHELGSSCDMHGECASGLCGVLDGHGLCTETCDPGGDACPSGFSCQPPMLAGGSGQCVPGGPSSGWCAVAVGRPAAVGLGPLVLALLLWPRRRSRSRRRTAATASEPG